MIQSLAPRATHIATVRATSDRAAAPSTIAVPPFAARGAAELLRERAATSLAGLRVVAEIVQLSFLHFAIGQIRD